MESPTRTIGCILCANGNDLSEGDECASCGRKGLLFHALRNEELCTDGQKHDFQGWRDIIEDGFIRGGTTVCTKCGLSAMTHSLRYGP